VAALTLAGGGESARATTEPVIAALKRSATQTQE